MNGRSLGINSVSFRAAILIVIVLSIQARFIQPVQAQVEREVTLRVRRISTASMSSIKVSIYVNAIKVVHINDGMYQEFTFPPSANGENEIYGIIERTDMRSPTVKFAARPGSSYYATLAMIPETGGFWTDDMKLVVQAVEYGPATALIKVPEGAKVFVEVGDAHREMPVNKGICQFNPAKLLEVGKPNYYFAIKVDFSTPARDYTESHKLRLFANQISELDLRDIALPDRSRRTFWFWSEIKKIGEEQFSDPKLLNQVDTLRAMKKLAAEVEALPPRGVDEEAITIGQELARFFEKSAKVIEENSGSNLGAKIVNGAIHGAFFDFSPVVKQDAENKKSIDDKIALTAKLKDARKILSARHNRDFPYLFWTSQFQFPCSLCKTELIVRRDQTGKKLQCAACKKTIVVPPVDQQVSASRLQPSRACPSS